MSRRKNAKETRQAGPERRRRWWLWASGLVVVGGVVWTLVATRHPPVTRAATVEYAPVTGPLTLPVKVASAAPDLRALYEFAARRPDVLRFLPCFCGCGWTHTSNYDCFIDEVRGDGLVLIDDMSFS
ncbi:MAG: PCYCGC motif-containing (lipo)protein [Gemmatimonadales bacterium]